jgi:hypothetical protein
MRLLDVRLAEGDLPPSEVLGLETKPAMYVMALNVSQ